jgi:hypothetical protein
MNTETANSNRSNSSVRCRHQFENGTRCRLPVLAVGSAFCPRHARLGQNQPVEEDLKAVLLKNSQDFQTAQGINLALGNLFDLVAQNRISTRRAAVLAYINSLLLRTLPAIDYDILHGAKDPSKPRANQNPAQTDGSTNAPIDALLADVDTAKKPS